MPSAARSLSDSSIALVSSTGGGSSGAARPLQLPRPWRSSSRTWTPAQLARERAAFFDTRVTGRPETWAAVRLAVELARDEGDAPAAAEVLRAAGCTCPTGRMGEGVWDERGVLYVLPRWVGSDPVNVGEGAVDAAGMAAGGLGSVDEDEDVDDEGGSARHDVMAEKGTGMTVRARLSDRATDVVVDVNPTTSVRSLMRAVQAAGGVSFRPLFPRSSAPGCVTPAGGVVCSKRSRCGC